MALIIFLLPTLAMFYFLAFIKLVISVLGLQICLLIAQIFLVHFPFHLLVFVQRHAHIMPNGIKLEVQSCAQNHIRMVPIPTNKSSLFIQLRREFAKMIQVSSPGIVVQSILRGDNLLRIMRNLLKTLDRGCSKHDGQQLQA